MYMSYNMEFTAPSDESSTKVGVEMPSNFISIIIDFVNDLSTTFPEYSYLWDKWISKDTTVKEYEDLFLYCMKVYPERFFDILYQNDEIFENTNTTVTLFLPNVEFKMLFSCENITTTIKQTLWKYLQLVLMTIMSSVKDKADFGESANIFDGINEDELQGKLNETIESLGNFFKTMENQKDSEGGENNMSSEETFQKMFSNMSESFEKDFNNDASADGSYKNNMPSADNINHHLKGIFNGKIGSLAKELADELSDDIMGMFGDDVNEANIKDPGDIFKKLMKNPKKIIDLIKSVSGKLNSKMASGNISQEELMREAGDLIGKMKGMGGGSEFSDIIKNLTKNMAGFGGGAGKNKLDMNAISRMSSQQSMRERMKAKLESKKQMPPPAPLVSKTTPEFILENKDMPNNFVFKLQNEEEQEKSSIGQEKSATAGGKKKGKKGKK